MLATFARGGRAGQWDAAIAAWRTPAVRLAVLAAAREQGERINAAFANLARASRLCEPLLRDFGAGAEAHIAEAERAYLARFRRLPGSTRTVRLRKKRESMVTSWFARR